MCFEVISDIEVIQKVDGNDLRKENHISIPVTIFICLECHVDFLDFTLEPVYNFTFKYFSTLRILTIAMELLTFETFPGCKH